MEKLHKLIQTLQSSPATSRTVMMDDVKIPGQTFWPVRFSKFIINPMQTNCSVRGAKFFINLIETGNQLLSVFFSLNETARVPTTEVISFTKPDEDVITVLNSKVHFPREDH